MYGQLVDKLWFDREDLLCAVGKSSPCLDRASEADVQNINLEVPERQSWSDDSRDVAV